MKVGIIKIGGKLKTHNKRITNGNIEENKSITNLFLKNGIDVTLITAFDKNNNPKVFFGYDNVQCMDLETADTTGMDMLVVINGSTNFYGGFDTNHVFKTYQVINSYKGNQVLFFYTDPATNLKQIWSDNILNKKNEKWGTNWTKEDLYISRDDITFMSAAKNLSLDDKMFQKKGIPEFKDLKIFEWQKSVLFESEYTTDLSDKSVDLIYGGYFRGGARKQQMLDYFFDTDYSARFFGKITLDMFKLSEPNDNKQPEFVKLSGDWNFFKDSTSNALSTVIFAESEYQDNIVTMRVYASVLANVVVFVEDKYDSKHTIFGDGFNYINSKEELSEKIAEVKTWSTEKYFNFCKDQKSKLRINQEDFFADFAKIVNLETKDLSVKQDLLSDW